MRKRINIGSWEVFQDVHDIGEKLEIYMGNVDQTNYSHLMSPWEKIDLLTYLQKIYSTKPYYGRELRYFNNAPWWYRASFTIQNVDSDSDYLLEFDMIDYFCKIWINGKYCGKHVGYQEKVKIDATPYLKCGKNDIYVKVSSPWDSSVLKGYEDRRFFSVERQMLKGTYEHADGFIQRDVNPIGIVGKVALETRKGSWLNSISVKTQANNVVLNIGVGGNCNGMNIDIQILDSNCIICKQETVKGQATGEYVLAVDEAKYWETWDRGTPNLYTANIILKNDRGATEDVMTSKFGFASWKIKRTKEETIYYLNDRKIFIRGTIYFPDVYFAELSAERIRRDLLLIRDAGFNAIRVHVHIEQDCFYDLCDEIGLLVFQDTDYSWCHPTNKEWIMDSLQIFETVVKRLLKHPSIACFILLNEPDKWKTSIVNKEGCSLSDIVCREDSITKSIGEPLTRLVKQIAPSIPYIRASYNEEDMESGDSHNYIGSLRGENTNYIQIRGTTEKLNTEFGMDVPGTIENIFKESAIFNALKPVLNRIEDMQYYQYKLLKYYIEHYRRQKYSPCGGYFQFMFIDLCPQSFYGVLDYWGTPKKGLNALLESNQPIAVMAMKSEYSNNGSVEIVIANDTDKMYNGSVIWSFVENGIFIDSNCIETVSYPDSTLVVGIVEELPDISSQTELHITFQSKDGNLIAKNKYIAPFIECRHIEGHPSHINSELGVRIYRK